MSAGTRMADALLRSLGGRTVLLRIPAPAVPGDAGEQLGLISPGFQDVVLGPAVFRKVRARVTADAVEYELLVSAAAVAAVSGGSATTLFGSAAAVVVDGALLGITGVASAEAFGSAYLYRVSLRSSVKDLV